jgi:hypothetical protein
MGKRNRRHQERREADRLAAADLVRRSGGLPPGFYIAESPEARAREEQPFAQPSKPVSTGPKTPEGKARSAQNARTHGLTSKQLFLPGENQEEFVQLREEWIAQYAPESAAEVELVEQLARNHWFLKRAERRYGEVEARLGEGSAAEWSEEQFRLLERIARYKTTAERSFQRSLTMVRQLRQDRLREERAEGQAEERLRRIEEKAAQGRVVYEGRGKNRKPVFRVLEQWLEVTVTDGVTRTEYVPSNDELIRENQAAVDKGDAVPRMVYRRMNFPDGVPAEYAWTNLHENETCELAQAGEWCALCQVRERGGHGIQRMTYETWLRVIEREKESPGGHAGPTGVGNLPRPKERGGEMTFEEMRERWVEPKETDK